MSFRLTGIALAILVILGGIVWYTELRDKGSAEAQSADQQLLEIFKFDDRSTRQLEVAKGDQKTVAQQDDQGNWTLQPSGEPGDRVRLSSLLTRQASLRATRKVADDASDLSQYGLDQPSLIATITQADGTSYILQVGAKAPTETGTYVKRGSDNSVYMVSNVLASDLDRMVTDPPIQPPTPTPSPSPSPSPTPPTG